MNFEKFVATPAAELLFLMGSEKRLMALDLLTESEMSVGNLAVQVGLSQSALSQHLGKMRKVGLVTARRDQQTIYYSCNSDAVRAIIQLLRKLAESDRLGRSPHLSSERTLSAQEGTELRRFAKS